MKEPGQRWSRATLAIAFVIVAVFALLGIGVEGKLRPTTISIPGSGSDQGEELLQRHFGDQAPFVILLQGPATALDRQGPALVQALRTEQDAITLSPWDRGSLERLRPGPRRALILVDFRVDAADAVSDAVPALEGLLASFVHPPVRATQTGYASLSRAIQDESVKSTKTAELLAIPILLLVLLLVFRSPVAALVPLLFGAAAVLATRGCLALAAPHMVIDGFALTVATMMGLALGVDYALLMVSRFREELAAGRSPSRAAASTRRTAGRTTAFAGSTLVLAMAVILFVMPGSLFLSLAGTAILVTLISVLIATVVAPPALYLLGPNVDRWRIGPTDGGERMMGVVQGALRRPKVAAGVIGGVLVLFALPVLELKTGPPSVDQLSESNAAREDAEAIGIAIGEGWDAPFVVVAASDHGPITDNGSLSELRRTQRRIAVDPGVQAVVGPGQIQRRISPLQEQGNELLSGEGATSPAKLARLGRKLDQASSGLGRLRVGIGEAAAGAGLLASGSTTAGEGATQIAGGLDGAISGADEAVGALNRIDAGSGRLAAGQHDAARGSEVVRDELAGLMPLLRQGGLAQARALREELRAAAPTDPELEGALDKSELLVDVLTDARNQTQKARNLATRVHKGQEKLADGGDELHEGAGRLADEAGALPAGLERLRDGATELAGGLERLSGGADQLSLNLHEGADRSQPLQGGLAKASVRVTDSADQLADQVGQLRHSSPEIFDSGYFVLSALDGAPPADRARAGQVVDLASGGQAAQILVIPRYTFNTPGSRALNARLGDEAAALADTADLHTGVTGGPAQLIDYSNTISSRVPLVVLAITLVTFLVLVLVLRAVPLAAIAVGLNLLTVAVAFGVLTLLFEVPASWPLGGHGYVDAIGAAGIFGIIFGLSIDYAVFLLSRMRERHDAGASNEEAIAFGLRRTARVITGAAAIMVAVFVAFAAAPIATVSQLGTGLTVAVILDATVVRIVLLPALMLIVGERVWWLPRPLARVLPNAGIHTS